MYAPIMYISNVLLFVSPLSGHSPFSLHIFTGSLSLSLSVQSELDTKDTLIKRLRMQVS